MVKELLFHIGDHKTGSTSIQQALVRRECVCDSVSLAYPVGKSRLHHKVAADTLSRKDKRPRRKRAFNTIARRMERQEADIGIVSAESFETVKPKALDNAIKRFFPDHAETARVIAYVRPHADRIVSSYTQVLKLGNFTGTLEDFARHSEKTGRYIYTPRFEAWRELFGDRFELRPMIRDRLYQGDVVKDFLSYVLRTTDFTMKDSVGANESLSLSDVVMLRAYHRMPKLGQRKVDVRGKAGWHFARVLAELPTEDRTRLGIHKSLMDQIETTYRADAEALDAAFFDGTPMAEALDRSHGKALPEAQSLELADYFDADAMRLIPLFAAVTDDLLARQPKDWQGYFRKMWLETMREARP